MYLLAIYRQLMMYDVYGNLEVYNPRKKRKVS